ncbi:sialic acid utilization regulator [Cutibacterium acnes JCM 18918]|nr:sialic acid utilization regulator [Cutibacterium acnes JCM 18918]
MDDSLLPRIDMARTTMRPAEAQVAAVILAKPDWTLAASTSQLAEAAGVSPRLSCAFAEPLMSGYRELRTELARDLSRRTLELERSSVLRALLLSTTL